MHASTIASLTSSILSRGIWMNSPSAAAWAVATISMSGATGIVRETSRAPDADRPGRTVSRRDISVPPRIRIFALPGKPRVEAAGEHTSRARKPGECQSWGADLKAEKEAQPAQDGFGERVTGEKSEARQQPSGEER